MENVDLSTEQGSIALTIFSEIEHFNCTNGYEATVFFCLNMSEDCDSLNVTSKCEITGDIYEGHIYHIHSVYDAWNGVNDLLEGIAEFHYVRAHL